MRPWNQHLMATAIAASSLGSAACTFNAYSPPARTTPLESPATLPEGQSSIAIEGGGGGEIFGPKLLTGTMRVRRGFAPEVDGNVELTGIYVGDYVGRAYVEGRPSQSANRLIASLRFGGKRNLLRHFAVTGGVGVGASAGGTYLSPDVGVIAGYENPYVVPFISLRGYVSVPLESRTVVYINEDGTSMPDRPETTLGLALGLGVRVPVGDDAPGSTHGSITAGLGVLSMRGGASSGSFSNAQLGGEVVF